VSSEPVFSNAPPRHQCFAGQVVGHTFAAFDIERHILLRVWFVCYVLLWFCLILFNFCQKTQNYLNGIIFTFKTCNNCQWKHRNTSTTRTVSVIIRKTIFTKPTFYAYPMCRKSVYGKTSSRHQRISGQAPQHTFTTNNSLFMWIRVFFIMRFIFQQTSIQLHF
jgi:hypothetical protein